MRTLTPLLVLAATLVACAESHPVSAEEPSPSPESRADPLRPDAVTLLRDIVPRTSDGYPPEPRLVAATRQYVFFTAEGSFDQLWRTDGTAEGTLLLRDMNVSGYPAITGLTAFKDRVFFAVDDGASSVELWTSDGTREGTRMVKDLNPGPIGATLENFTVASDWLYFTAKALTASVSPVELWKTDGTEEGTTRVFTFEQPGLPQTGAQFTAVGSTLYFQGYTNSTHGYGLWKTDGTAAGTQRVVDGTGLGLSSISDLTPAGEQLYLFANGTVYRTDGTPAGTRRLVTRTGGYPTSFEELTALGSRAVFSAYDTVNGDALWLTDGTPEGTKVLKDIEPDEPVTSMQGMTECGPYVYFSALVLSGQSYVDELWRTDGTAAGTQRLVRMADDLRTRACVGGRLFFLNYASGGPLQLGLSNGTVAGTGSLRDFQYTERSGIPRLFTPWGNELAFVMGGGPGAQVWRSNGTVAGTAEIPAVHPKSPWGTRIESWLELDGKLLFSAMEWIGSTTESHLYLTDGTPAGTSRIDAEMEKPSYSSGRPLVKAGSKVFFIGEGGSSGPELWATDGTNAGTYEVKNIGPGGFSGFPRHFAALDGILYFQADDGAAGKELWRSDGTDPGTYLLMDLYPGQSSGNPSHLVAHEGFIYFAAAGATGGNELWRTDGTPAGTTQVADLRAGSVGSAPENLRVFGGKLYFTADDGVSGRELWRLDSSGPVRISDIGQGSSGGALADFMATSDALYFSASNSALGTELYRVAGDSVELVADILPQNTGSYPKPLAASGRVLYFAATDSWRGRELWRTDGTPEGTYLVKDINPGPESTFTRDGYRGDGLALPDGSVLFAAIHGAEGRELWRTDGTEAGTVPALNLWPGPQSGGPVLLAELGGRVILEMSDPMTGEEVRAFSWEQLNDRTPPTLQGCPDVTVEATSSLGATVTFSLSASDDQGGSVRVSSPRLSGSQFPLGLTEFEITATDIAGNTARCAARVQVRDTTPPSVQCPASFAVQASGPSGAAPTWTPPRATDVTGTPAITAEPAPGTLLPIGVHEVTVTATDTSGNTATCGFTVTVNPRTPGSSPDGGTSTDGGTPPGGEPPPDGGTDDEPTGCGCASGAGSLSLLAWGALGLLLRRRRR